MTVLAVIAAVAIIVVGLVSVPWPVLLLLLLAGLIAAQRALASIPKVEGHPVPAGTGIDALTLTPTLPSPVAEPTASPIAAALEAKGKCLKYRGVEVHSPVPPEPVTDARGPEPTIAPTGAELAGANSEATLDAKGKYLKYRGAVYVCPECPPDQPDGCEVEIAGTYRGSPLTVHLRGKALLS
ncbi:hypothetical protein [Trichothermofontia sp.]